MAETAKKRAARPVQEVVVQSGNEIAATAAKHVNYHIMGYYPITPSTEIAETLDAMKAEGEHTIRMIPGDGEHGAAGICFGGTTAGGRVFNATSANGLLFAFEQLPVQSGTRFPMVFNIVTRSVSGPLDIRGDHSDIMLAMNTGWIVLMASDVQAVYDMNGDVGAAPGDGGLRRVFHFPPEAPRRDLLRQAGRTGLPRPLRPDGHVGRSAQAGDDWPIHERPRPHQQQKAAV
jgi:hypothetical protein